MAKTIQELRREKGYRSAREFADALGISPSSMSRYDNQPDTIPVKVAWAMADRLDCSIDEVVGRMPVTSGKSELQEFYDGLHRWNKELFDEFREFIKAREQRAASLEHAAVDRKYERLAQYYERKFNNAVFDYMKPEDLVAFDQPWMIRDGIASLVEDELEESRARRAHEKVGEMTGATQEEDEAWLNRYHEELARIEAEEGSDGEVIDGIMEAYDRLHGAPVFTDYPKVLIEYLTTQPPK